MAPGLHSVSGICGPRLGYSGRTCEGVSLVLFLGSGEKGGTRKGGFCSSAGRFLLQGSGEKGEDGEVCSARFLSMFLNS